MRDTNRIPYDSDFIPEWARKSAIERARVRRTLRNLSLYGTVSPTRYDRSARAARLQQSRPKRRRNPGRPQKVTPEIQPPPIERAEPTRWQPPESAVAWWESTAKG